MSDKLKSLGSGKTTYEFKKEAQPELLESFTNKHPGEDYLIPFNMERDEFTSLCVSGDTKIDVVGKDFQGNIKIKDLVGKTGYAYSYSNIEKRIVLRKFSDVRKTQKDAELIEIEYINKKGKKFTLKLTKEHPVMLHNGIFIPASELNENDSIMSFGKYTIKGYTNLHDKKNYYAEHKFIAKELQIDNEIIHHKNHNKLDNCLNNLLPMTLSKHNQHHRYKQYKYEGKITKKILEQKYLKELETISNIARYFKCDDSTIFNRLIRYNIPIRTKKEIYAIQKTPNKIKKNIDQVIKWYKQGYLLSEIASVFNCHSTTVSSWLKDAGVKIKESNIQRYSRKKLLLPELNHKIVSIKSIPKEDVYNMEVQDTNNFVANEAVLHNCPMTGQPDQARMEIVYVPNNKCVESKSLKLYLMSYRMSGEFHEDVCNRIANDLFNLLEPKYLRVYGDFSPRGGIAIRPIVQRWGHSWVDNNIINLVNMWDIKK